MGARARIADRARPTVSRCLYAMERLACCFMALNARTTFPRVLRPVTTACSVSRISAPTGTGVLPCFSLSFARSRHHQSAARSLHVANAHSSYLTEPGSRRSNCRHQPEQVAVPTLFGVNFPRHLEKRADLGIRKDILIVTSNGPGLRLHRPELRGGRV